MGRTKMTHSCLPRELMLELYFVDDGTTTTCSIDPEQTISDLITTLETHPFLTTEQQQIFSSNSLFKIPTAAWIPPNFEHPILSIPYIKNGTKKELFFFLFFPFHCFDYRNFSCFSLLSLGCFSQFVFVLFLFFVPLLLVVFCLLLTSFKGWFLTGLFSYLFVLKTRLFLKNGMKKWKFFPL